MQCGHHFEHLKPTTSRKQHSLAISQLGGGREAGLCLEAQQVPLVVWRIQALAGCHTRASVSRWPSPGSCPRLLAGCGMVSGSSDGQALWRSGLPSTGDLASARNVILGIARRGDVHPEFKLSSFYAPARDAQPSELPASSEGPPEALLALLGLVLGSRGKQTLPCSAVNDEDPAGSRP